MIEILVGLSIGAILLAIAAIAFNRWTTKYNVENEIRQMYADLMEARVRAMGSNRYRFVTFNTAGYAVYDDTNNDGVLQPSVDSLVLQKNMQNPVTLSPSGTAQIYFDQHGLASANTTISVANSSGAVYDCISITQTRTGLGKMDNGICVQK